MFDVAAKATQPQKHKWRLKEALGICYRLSLCQILFPREVARGVQFY